MKLSADGRAVGRGDVIKWRRRVVLSSNRAGVYVRSLPKFTKGWQSPNQRAWVDAFSRTARASKTPSPQELDSATQLAKGTLWYYRDVIQTAMYGKLFRFNHEVLVRTPTVFVSRSTVQNLTTLVELSLTPNTVTWDNNVFWSSTVNPTRLTMKSAGLYLVGCRIAFRPENTNPRLARIRMNGTTYIANTSATGNTSFPLWLECTTIQYFHANEYIEARALNAGAGANAQLDAFYAVAITPENLIP